MGNKSNEVHHRLLNSEVDVVFRSEGNLGVERVRNTEVTMLTEDDQTLGLLCDSFGHEACVVVKAVDITLIT